MLLRNSDPRSSYCKSRLCNVIVLAIINHTLFQARGVENKRLIYLTASRNEVALASIELAYEKKFGSLLSEKIKVSRSHGFLVSPVAPPKGYRFAARHSAGKGVCNGSSGKLKALARCTN